MLTDTQQLPMRIVTNTVTLTLCALAMPASAAACTLLNAGTSVVGWGAAYNVFSTASELVLDASCNDASFVPRLGSAQTNAGNFAVYGTGYYFDGEGWRELSYRSAENGERVGAWILGDAVATAPIGYGDTTTFFAAYTCHWRALEARWRCGCQDTACETGLWQLQGVSQPVATAAAPADRSTSAGALERAVVAYTNELRVERGLPPLAENAALTRAARAHSRDMSRNEYFSHRSRSGDELGDRVQAAGYAWSAVAENISRGYASPEAVVAAWMESPGHRENLLNERYTQIGVGYVDGGTQKDPYWTQVLAAPQ